MAADYGTLIFEDTFDRTESQELKDEPGNEWTTSSDKTAEGNKEVDLRDGYMYIYTHEVAWHATSVGHAFEFQDGTLALRFMLEDDDDELNLNFATWNSNPFGPAIYSRSFAPKMRSRSPTQKRVRWI